MLNQNKLNFWCPLEFKKEDKNAHIMAAPLNHLSWIKIKQKNESNK